MIAADTYELSPMQQGMLYHTIETERTGMYSIVVSYRLHGPLDHSAFVRAWQLVVARHPILRTSFHWRDRDEPIQIVHPDASVDVRNDDWRAASPAERDCRLDAVLEAEAGRGFDLGTPPLLRLSLFRCEDDVHELVLAHHHLLMDGSCKPLLFREVFEAYEAFRRGEPLHLPPPRPYREFIEWLRVQDLVEAERFWRQELAGVAEPTRLWPAAPSRPVREDGYAEQHARLDVDASDALRETGRRYRLTLNTIVAGAWALLLSRASGSAAVVFGATVNARPSGLDGAESMLGLFINTLPVRVQVDPAAATAPWLQRLQTRQAGARDYDYAPLSKVQRWSDVPRGRPLFESIVVFENNVGYGLATERYGTIEIRNVRPVIRNSLPLTLRCVPGRALSLQLLYDTSRFSNETLRAIADDLLETLRELPHAASGTLSRLFERLDEVARARGAVQAQAFDARAIAKLRSIKQQSRLPGRGSTNEH